MLTRARHVVLLLIGLFLGIPSAAGQEPPKPSSQPDYSKEAFVDEQELTKVVFENDGTSTRNSSNRIRIQSDAGVQRFGVLTYPYQSATESVEIVYIRVRKPDGSVISTPTENIQDMPSEITRQAPFYSDLHEKHVAVKGLSVGDVLETEVRWHVTKPLAPGQFWFSYNFAHDFILLNEQLQISVPRARPLKWKSPDCQPTIKDEGEHRVFTWTHSELQHKTDDETKQDQEKQVYQAARGKLPPPDVELSTFQTWEEVGAWYSSLQSERVKPSPEIRAKAAELTKDAKDDEAKLHALYNYVSTQFRYIGVAFGIGRYQPHAAGEVLANQYGDCKDKHTLLAALLEAAGIKAYPALINASRDMDLDVPSPSQFDHVITAVPQGNGFTWLDTTAEVAPYGYLIVSLLSKASLVVQPTQATMAHTPNASGDQGVQTFNIEAVLKIDGHLEGTVVRTFHAESSELSLRSALKSLPASRWAKLVQQLSNGTGPVGDVSQVTVEGMQNIEQPLRISYNYARARYPDWEEHQVEAALPRIERPNEDTIKQQLSRAIWLGELHTQQFTSKIKIPQGFRIEPTLGVNLSFDFAEYHSSYAFRDGFLIVRRQFRSKLMEVPIAEQSKYIELANSIAEDEDRRIQFSSGEKPAQAATQRESWKESQQDIANLPDSSIDEVLKQELKFKSYVSAENLPEAIATLQNALSIDPTFTRGWMELGQEYLRTHEIASASQAFAKAAKCDPKFTLAGKMLAFSLIDLHRPEEALTELRRVGEVAPQDFDTPGIIAGVLATLGRYGESIPEYETALRLNPHHSALHSLFGISLLHVGEDERAASEFKRALELDPSSSMRNTVAYELAEAGKKLTLALQCAEQAVRKQEDVSQQINLSDVSWNDIRTVEDLGSYWDTLGWVHFQLQNLNQAERYLDAAWMLTQGYVEADHLGQLYERRGDKSAAIRMYQLAIASAVLYRGENEKLADIRAHLNRLQPIKSEAEMVASVKAELTKLRTLQIPPITAEKTTADFFVLLSPKSVKSKFVGGSAELATAEATLNGVDFHTPFPNDHQVSLLRRGTLSCSPGGCAFVLYRPGDSSID